MKKKILIFSSFLIFTFLILAFRPISATRQNCQEIDGIVSEIYEGGVKDAVIKLVGKEAIYYINRGLEKKFTLDALKQRFEGKEVTISYSKQWTPLDPFNNNRHICELIIGQEIVYTEL